MRFLNTRAMSLSDATKPLLLVSRLIGMNPKSNWHKIYPFFIIVSELLILFWVWHYFYGISVKNYYFKAFLYSLEDGCRTSSLFIILGSSLLDRKRFMVPLKDFASVDRSLKSITGFIENRSAYRFQIVLATSVGLMTLLFGLVEFSIDILSISDDQLFRIVVMSWCCDWTATIVCAIADCSFSSTLLIIRKRFREINLIIQRSGNHGSYLRINFLEIFSEQTGNGVSRDLRILRKQYHDLWGIVNRVNRAYGLHLLVGATTSLALISNNLWKCYTALIGSDGIRSYNVVKSIIWALFYSTKMLFLVTTSESTIAEAKATYLVLQEFGMKENHDSATKNEIRDFLTQLKLEVQKITACGFFNVDFTLIYGIIGAACTYVVILIQMEELNACKTTAGHFNEGIYYDEDHLST